MAADGRDNLLNAGERLFADRGYSATSVRDICSAANVTQPSLYHFFGSKENLLVELVTDRYDAYCASLESTIANESTPEAVSRAYAKFVFSRMTQAPTTAKFVFSILFGPQQDIPHETLDIDIDRSRSILSRHLQRTAPDVPARRIRFCSILAHGMITPAVLQFLVTGFDAFSDSLVEAFAQRAAASLTDDLPVAEWPEPKLRR